MDLKIEIINIDSKHPYFAGALVGAPAVGKYYKIHYVGPDIDLYSFRVISIDNQGILLEHSGGTSNGKHITHPLITFLKMYGALPNGGEWNKDYFIVEISKEEYYTKINSSVWTTSSSWVEDRRSMWRRIDGGAFRMEFDAVPEMMVYNANV